MSIRRVLPTAAVIWLVLAVCGSAVAQVSISAPAGSASLAHDTTDNDQVFAAQNWQVQSNGNQGATVTFSTNQAFTNTADASYRRDARLNLAIASAHGPAGWAIVVASDQTNYVGGDGVATVQARSTKRGNATFDVTVTFITAQYETLGEGTYQLTVTGLVTGN